MNKLKYLSAVLLAAILTAVIVVACKKDDPKPFDEGKKAGQEMCACVASKGAAPNPADVMAFMAYATSLQDCLGGLAPYQKYVVANPFNYDPTAEDKLMSVFTFTDAEFKRGFNEGVASCKDAFIPLLALLEQMGQ